MYEQVDKSKENKSRVVASSVAQKKSNSTQGFGFGDSRPESTVQRQLQKTLSQSPKLMQFQPTNNNESGVIQLNGEWNIFQKAVEKGTMNIAISAKHIKGKKKTRRMERKGGKRNATGPYSNQSQEQVLQHAIDAVKQGTARFISSDGSDFTIEVDSIHRVHDARQFNIHSGGGSENTRYIHQVSGDSSGYETPDDAKYSDSESEYEVILREHSLT